MRTTLKTEITIREVIDGFEYNELEGKGLFGLSGKLTIQPEYQRNYIYADGKKRCCCNWTVSLEGIQSVSYTSTKLAKIITRCSTGNNELQA